MPILPSRDAPRHVERYQIGDVVSGRYRLLDKLGEGAMGTVWVAQNLALGSKVALKLIRPEMRLPIVVERLMREARAAARLSHSAIVRIFDLGETAGGDPYIVMELLDGGSLGRLLDREPKLSPQRALSLILPIASGMQSAHDLGVIHRDLKPDNIMLTTGDGGVIQPKVVDFGIVKLRATVDDPAATGSIAIGTPEYMSPEQAGGGGEVDHRSDIWSLCTLLYEALAGTTPFRSGSTWEVLSAVVRDPVPSLETLGVTDAALWAILERGLRKDPAERWQSMKELHEALSAWLSERGLASESRCDLRSDRPADPEGPALARPVLESAPSTPGSLSPIASFPGLAAERTTGSSRGAAIWAGARARVRAQHVAIAAVVVLVGLMVWMAGPLRRTASAVAVPQLEAAALRSTIEASPRDAPVAAPVVASAPAVAIAAPPAASSAVVAAPIAAAAPPLHVALSGRMPGTIASATPSAAPRPAGAPAPSLDPAVSTGDSPRFSAPVGAGATSSSPDAGAPPIDAGSPADTARTVHSREPS